ncbi:MAG: MFS transporter [Methanosarcinales archaeon]|nr:MFS transporter [Methanosarcinales archaeon]MCD4808839.1 MFS transporter [Methanosarcinales archaeon]
MLSNRYFLFLWFVNITTTLAIELFTVTILVTIYEQTASTLLAAGTMVARTMPAFLLGPVAGVLVDRFPRKNILIVMDLVRFVLVGIAILFLQGDGKVPVASIYLILAGLSAADVFHRPARLSLIPSLVAHEQLVKANSLIMASNQVIMAISYTVGGWLILAVPLRQIALYVIILFAMAALAAMFIVVPKRQEAKDASEKESFWKSLASGWNYLRQHPIARPLTIMETVEHLPHGIWTGALMLAFTTKALHGDASDWGYQVTSFFMGMILGSIGVLVISNWLTRYPGRIIVVNAFAAGLFTLAYAGSQTVLMAVACSFMFGPPVAIRDVAQDSLLQGTVERDQLGRVYATQEMLRNMAFMFACIFFAWLSDFVPIRLIYVIGGIMYLFTGAYALGNKALRESKMGTFIQPFEKMH